MSKSELSADKSVFENIATGVRENLVEIPVGLKGEQDLIADFAQWLEILSA